MRLDKKLKRRLKTKMRKKRKLTYLFIILDYFSQFLYKLYNKLKITFDDVTTEKIDPIMFLLTFLILKIKILISVL